MTLTSTSEWAAYAAEPAGPTLERLRRAAGGETDELLAAMVELSRTQSGWRILQHLAIAFENRGFTTEAHYYAERAVRASHGDVRARLVLARVHEARRFVDAIFHELGLVRLGLRGVRDPRTRRVVRAELAAAYVRLYCYLGRPTQARPWLRYVMHAGRGTVDTFVHVLNGTIDGGRDADLRAIAAMALVSAQIPASSRTGARIQMVVRALFLDLLRERAK